MDPLVVTPAVTLPPSDFVWEAVRASGPGGQNVNKVSSKVELRFNLPGTTALSDVVKLRLRALASNRLDAGGWLFVSSQRTRDQSRNLEDAREKVRLLVLEALTPPTPRRPTKPSRGARARRLNDKHATSERKRDRGKSHHEE